MDIIGVDYSGAKPDRNTWVARGVLHGDELQLDWAESTKRADLTKLLEEFDGPLVAAMDFPFAVPKAFAEFWQKDAGEMPHLWEAAATPTITLEGYRERCDTFVKAHGEPIRKGDKFHPGCFSPLHQTNPNMVPMTFYGMRMLHYLWTIGNCSVPPLDDKGRTGPVLLEVMPGAVLSRLGLPSKGYKNGKNAANLRCCIWDNLPSRSGVKLVDAARFKEKALKNHDCLDAIVAAVAAALWHSNRGLFLCPTSPDEIRAARLEGWLYAPKSQP